MMFDHTRTSDSVSHSQPFLAFSMLLVMVAKQGTSYVELLHMYLLAH